MESYIVRVLRREQTNQETGGGRAVRLDGVVEAVDEDGGYRAFHSVDELWSILVSPDRGIPSTGGKATQNKTR